MGILLRRTRRRIAAFISDTHAGHRLGLLSPETVLIAETDDGGIEEWTPEPSKTQEYLWRLYQQHLAELVDFAGRDEIVAFHNGDATHGDRYREGLIPGTTQVDQRAIAKHNLMPFVGLKNVKKTRLITGTGVHVPTVAEARIARVLAQETKKDVASYHHARANIDGVLIEAAHHGPYPGSRDWLRGNVALYHLKDRVYRDRRMGKRPADVYVYGHYHEWVHVTLNEEWNDAASVHHLVIVPSYCGLTAHARKVTKSAPFLTNGLAAFEIIDGKLVSIRPFKATLDLRTEETL